MNEIKVDEVSKTWHESALQNQREIGLWILRTLILLNGGGVVLLLTLLSSSSNEAAFIVEVSAVKFSATGFLIGLTFTFLLAATGYATALYSYPYSGTADIPLLGHTWVEPAYFLFGLASFLAFAVSVLLVVNGVSAR
jgi:hypothetical protein